jgi:hypothetical protein
MGFKLFIAIACAAGLSSGASAHTIYDGDHTHTWKAEGETGGRIDRCVGNHGVPALICAPSNGSPSARAVTAASAYCLMSGLPPNPVTHMLDIVPAPAHTNGDVVVINYKNDGGSWSDFSTFPHPERGTKTLETITGVWCWENYKAGEPHEEFRGGSHGIRGTKNNLGVNR